MSALLLVVRRRDVRRVRIRRLEAQSRVAVGERVEDFLRPPDPSNGVRDPRTGLRDLGLGKRIDLFERAHAREELAELDPHLDVHPTDPRAELRRFLPRQRGGDLARVRGLVGVERRP